MTPLQMSKVWSVVSLLLLYYALNSYLVTQGGEPVFGAMLIMKSRVPAGFLAIPICSLLLLLASLIGIEHANATGAGWANRIPLVGFEQLDTKRREARAYQGVMLFFLTLVPAVTLAHFWSVAAGASIATTAPHPVLIPGGMWDWSALTSWDNPASICSEVKETDGQIICEGRTTILPGLEPTIFAVLTGLALIAMVWFWWTIAIGRQPPKSDSHSLQGPSDSN